MIFTPHTLNIFKLGQYSHFGLLMSNNSYKWIEITYNHIWSTANTAHTLAMEYMMYMYMPTHTRFGPFFVGGVLACNYQLIYRS